MKETLQECVDIALENRLQEQSFTDSHHLLGDCYYNVKELAKVMDENDVEYTVYRGALEEDFAIDDQPETFNEANEMGYAHYWIESHGFVCEISSEARYNYGDPLVSKERPENYLVFSDSEVHRI